MRRIRQSIITPSNSSILFFSLGSLTSHGYHIITTRQAVAKVTASRRGTPRFRKYYPSGAYVSTCTSVPAIFGMDVALRRWRSVVILDELFRWKLPFGIWEFGGPIVDWNPRNGKKLSLWYPHSDGISLLLSMPCKCCRTMELPSPRCCTCIGSWMCC